MATRRSLMRVLLDTQVLVLAATDAWESIPQGTRSLMSDQGTDRLVSAISFAEIAMKTQIGKLKVEAKQLATLVEDLTLTAIDFKPEHALKMFSVPAHHGDPFDRMLIATALHEEVPLVGSDREYVKYQGLKVIW